MPAAPARPGISTAISTADAAIAMQGWRITSSVRAPAKLNTEVGPGVPDSRNEGPEIVTPRSKGGSAWLEGAQGCPRGRQITRRAFARPGISIGCRPEGCRDGPYSGRAVLRLRP